MNAFIADGFAKQASDSLVFKLMDGEKYPTLEREYARKGAILGSGVGAAIGAGLSPLRGRGRLMNAAAGIGIGGGLGGGIGSLIGKSRTRIPTGGTADDGSFVPTGTAVLHRSGRIKDEGSPGQLRALQRDVLDQRK